MQPTTVPAQVPSKMRAIAQSHYGSADMLQQVEVDRPAMLADGVLVRVRATAVHAGDWHLMRGTPFIIRLIYGGLRKPRIKILGTDVAGEVVAVGQNVTQFKPGDAVFGDLSEFGFGAFAEYVSAPETAFVLKPSPLTFEEAATVPVSALAALQGLRDGGQLQVGQKVLIRGASGGVGSFAVQIAKAWGAEVTAMCSSSKVEKVRSLNPDHIVDSALATALKPQHYDLILDAAAYQPISEQLQALTPGGIYVLVGGSTIRLFQAMLFGAWISKTSGRIVKFLVSKPNQADLTVLKDLIEAGKIRPFIDRTYPFSEIPAAIQSLEQRQVCGKIAISV